MREICLIGVEYVKWWVWNFSNFMSWNPNLSGDVTTSKSLSGQFVAQSANTRRLALQYVALWHWVPMNIWFVLSYQDSTSMVQFSWHAFPWRANSNALEQRMSPWLMPTTIRSCVFVSTCNSGTWLLVSIEAGHRRDRWWRNDTWLVAMANCILARQANDWLFWGFPDKKLGIVSMQVFSVGVLLGDEIESLDSCEHDPFHLSCRYVPSSLYGPICLVTHNEVRDDIWECWISVRQVYTRQTS